MEPRIYYKIRYVKHSAVVVSIILLMSAISMMPIKQKAYAISDYDRAIVMVLALQDLPFKMVCI
jgi:hypothetical protein